MAAAPTFIVAHRRKQLTRTSSKTTNVHRASGEKSYQQTIAETSVLYRALIPRLALRTSDHESPISNLLGNAPAIVSIHKR